MDSFFSRGCEEKEICAEGTMHLGQDLFTQPSTRGLCLDIILLLICFVANIRKQGTDKGQSRDGKERHRPKHNSYSAKGEYEEYGLSYPKHQLPISIDSGMAASSTSFFSMMYSFSLVVESASY